MLIGALSWPLKWTYSTWMTSLVVMLAVLIIETPADQRWARLAAMLQVVKCIATDTVGLTYYVVKICYRIIKLTLILFMRLFCKCLRSDRPIRRAQTQVSQLHFSNSELTNSGLLTSEALTDSSNNRGSGWTQRVWDFIAPTATTATNKKELLSSTPEEKSSDLARSLAASSMSGKVKRKPKDYDGSTDLLAFENHFNSIARHQQWPYEEKGEQLMMSLTGLALLAVTDECPGSTDFDTLMKVLHKRFRPSGHEEIFIAEFESRRKLEKESYTDFAFALRSLVSRAYPDIGHKGRESMVRKQFLATLDENISDLLMGEQNMEVMIALATQYQNKKKSRTLKKSSVNAIEETEPVDAMDRLISMTKAMMQDFKE